MKWETAGRGSKFEKVFLGVLLVLSLYLFLREERFFYPECETAGPVVEDNTDARKSDVEKVFRIKYRLLAEEMDLLIEKHSLTLWDALKFYIPFEERVREKRKKFNFEFVNLLIEHSICTPDIYEEMEILWRKAVAVESRCVQRFLLANFVNFLTASQTAREGWKVYMDGAKTFVDKRCHKLGKKYINGVFVWM